MRAVHGVRLSRSGEACFPIIVMCNASLCLLEQYFAPGLGYFITTMVLAFSDALASFIMGGRAQRRPFHLSFGYVLGIP
jgi:hypothetical protein